jgi:uncharacterized membrane protein YhiD involved in acid resistance
MEGLDSIALTEAMERLAIAFGLSFIYGMERQMRHKPIGFGTFIYVAMGSCAIGTMAVKFCPDNPLPLLGAVVTGIGFLGAGALVRTGGKIHGFTSAALIWIFAAFGLAIGVGYYSLAGATYVLVWIVTLYDQMLQRRGSGSYHHLITIQTRRLMPENEVGSALFGNSHRKLIDIKADKSNDRLTVTYSLEGTDQRILEFSERLLQFEWCESFEID